MKRLLSVLFAFIVVFSSCLPLIEPITMDDTPTTLNINKDVVLPPGTTVDGVDISTIAGAAHAQNTDTNMGVLAVKPLALDGDKFVIRDSAAGDVFSTTTGAQVKTFLGTHTQNTDWTLKDSAGGANLIHNGYIVSDMRTDRWLLSDRNTFFGVDIADGAGVLSGTMNSAYGNECMYDITTGASNTAVGWRSQKGLTEGNFNTSIGDQTLVALTTGTGNTAVGVSSLASVKTNGYNTAVGADVLWNATSGYNTGMGAFAGAAVVDGDNNVYIGYDAGNDNVSGDYNTAVGTNAGHTNTGSGNVFLGYKAGEDSAAVDNTLYIDNSDDTTPLIYGDFSTDKVTINEDLDVADDLTVTGTINTPGDATIKTDGTSARDLIIVTGADKTLVLDTVVFDDLRVPVTSTTRGGAKDPQFTVFKTNGAGSQGVFLYWLDASTEEELFFTAQIPHSYKLDTTIVPHIHWTPKVTADGTPANQVVRWGFEYTWVDKGQTFGDTSISYASTHYPADANVVAGKHYYSEFATLTPTATAGKDISSMLICRIFRDATSLTDNYEQDAGILEFDIHFGSDTLGSRTDLSK